MIEIMDQLSPAVMDSILHVAVSDSVGRASSSFNATIGTHHVPIDISNWL